MPQQLQNLEQTCRGIGNIVGQAIDRQYGKKKVGFALLLFDFGERGSMTYISNAQRQDMVKALYECAASLLAGEN